MAEKPRKSAAPDRPSRRTRAATTLVGDVDDGAPKDLNLRTRETTAPLSPESKRFDMFLIDTGWNHCVSKLVQSHLPILHAYQRQDSLYILSPEQSVEILRREPLLIGRDPTILLFDLHAPQERNAGKYRGFRIHLGRFRNGEQALARLQEFLRFVNLHRTAECLDREVKRELHREGLSGAVRLLREASEASVELFSDVLTSHVKELAVNEEFPILPTVVGLLVVSYLGFELNRQRGRLREVFNVFDKQDSVIADALESMVARGELKPYIPR